MEPFRFEVNLKGEHSTKMQTFAVKNFKINVQLKFRYISPLNPKKFRYPYFAREYLVKHMNKFFFTCLSHFEKQKI